MVFLDLYDCSLVRDASVGSLLRRQSDGEQRIRGVRFEHDFNVWEIEVDEVVTSFHDILYFYIPH